MIASDKDGRRRIAAYAAVTFMIGQTMMSQSAGSETLLRTDLRGIKSHELLVWTNDIPVGSTTDLHHHAGHEVVYVLNGEVKIRVGDRGKIYRKGTLILVPAGATMKVSNVSTKPAKTLVYMLTKKGADLTIKGGK